MSNDFEVWCTEVARCAEGNGWAYETARYLIHNFHRDAMRVAFDRGESPQGAAGMIQ